MNEKIQLLEKNNKKYVILTLEDSDDALIDIEDLDIGDMEDIEKKDYQTKD